MNERDRARSELKSTSGEKWIALKKYKSLRNRTTNQIREDVKQANGKRTDEANNESEYWKVVNDITSPKCDTKWKLIDDEVLIEEDQEIGQK